MDFIEKNNFIVNNASEKHFKADFETFKKIFPDSPIIPSLERAEAYNKKQLDERMLLEILEARGTAPILEGRQKPTANSQKPTAHSPQPTAKSQKPKANRQKPAPSDKKKADRE
jgi:hypothetical protein